jgi:hypothetical protein
MYVRNAHTHACIVAKNRWAARGQQRHLFAPVSDGVLGNEEPTSLNVKLAWLGSTPRIVLRLATKLFIEEKEFMIVDGKSHVIGIALRLAKQLSYSRLHIQMLEKTSTESFTYCHEKNRKDVDGERRKVKDER